MKDRPVVLVTPKAILENPTISDLVCVAVTTRPPDRTTDPDAEKLPNRADDVHSTTGLTRTCWALPRWFLLVDRAALRNPCGFVSNPKLGRIMASVSSRHRI